jgi:hypothetical protein
MKTAAHSGTRGITRSPRPLLLALLLLSCTSPTAPPPTGLNAAVSGTVVERVDGVPYSFLRLETEGGSMWVAVPMAEVPKKAKVVVKNGATLKNFESKQAGRRFDAVVFGVLEKG